MLRVLAGLLVVVLALAVAALVAGVIEGAETPRCDDREALIESDANECFEATAAEKTVGLVLTGAAAGAGALGIAAGVRYMRGRGGGGRMGLWAIAMLILAASALFFLRISF